MWEALGSPNNPKKKECHFIPLSNLGKAREIRVEGKSVISILLLSLRRVVCKGTW